ncbi:MAG: 50S ribosomal protein L24 [Rhodospirillaceae bacterium]|nr:50S ribosomal protein L24 [Rhodospirillaceae bacterium]|tara:strand:- start:409 stop:726 length:318 start_codon:yes stop_codon:yes gene_type:complete
MSSKIRKGDNVVVTKGKDKGKKGKVLNIDKLHNKAVVDGVNLYKRHIAPKQADPGGIKEVESAISISNLSIEDPKDGKPTKVGFKFLEDGKKVRFSKRSGEVIDN